MRENVVWLTPRPVAAGEHLWALQRINQFDVYELACALHPLSTLSANPDPVSVLGRLFRARTALDQCLAPDPTVRLTISRAAARELNDKIEALLQTRFTDPDTGRYRLPEGEGTVIESWELASVSRALEGFEAVLRAEMQSFAAFAVPKRGIYDTEDLVNAAERALPSSVMAVIPEKARVEVGSAGRCLAFGLFTAAGFHVCRGVEAVLEVYYQRFSGDTRTLKSWNDYHKELMALMLAAKADTPAPSQQAVAYIDQLRLFSRNPLMHPRVVLGEEEAFMLFDLGKVVICHMAQDLKAAGLAVSAVVLDTLAAAAK